MGVSMLPISTGWITATLLNGWTHYSDPGGTYQQARYRRDGNVVRLTGLLIPPASPEGVIFNLPAGFRPAERNIFTGTTIVKTGAATAGTAHTHTVTSIGGRLDVLPSGDVQQNSTLMSGWQSLAGITFLLGL